MYRAPSGIVSFAVGVGAIGNVRRALSGCRAGAPLQWMHKRVGGAHRKNSAVSEIAVPILNVLQLYCRASHANCLTALLNEPA